MRLVTFENPQKQRRAGGVAGDGIVDLNLACAAQHSSQGAAAYRIADALVPSEMRLLFEGGDASLDAARDTLAFAMAEGEALRGPSSEPVVFRRDQVTLKAPIILRKFFHTAGNFRGVAAFSDDPKAWYLKPGDVMECEIEKIGVLRNPVIAWEQAHGKTVAGG